MKRYELKIVQDESPMNPRTEWDNVTTMLCFHRRYDLGDETHYCSNNYDGWDEFEEQIRKDYNVLMLKPLYMYDHSGITISTSSFSCQWDSGQIGFILIEEKQWEKMMGSDMDRSEERLERIIDGEVEDYDKYLRGDVWGYKLYEVNECNLGHEHKELVESCYGFFDEDDCRSEGESMLESYEKESLVKSSTSVL